jgi:hypothetical protein
MAEKNPRQPPSAPRGEPPPQRPGEQRWTGEGNGRAPRHEGPLPEGNGGTGAPASFPPTP